MEITMYQNYCSYYNCEKIEWGKRILSEKQMPKNWYCLTNLKNMFLWENEIFGL